ncbi:flavin reductase family protein [Pacificoceanicola onchidii]|uniref:flavin reductase family protein n=1 Tax=Pacificoceanicola onchidii TaxID=2562685 RepID=UPI0010A66325|nr:flavin reductase family protein [Pacificoceanicola onchidii]
MSALDPQTLRRAFGSFMTGVTVVTARDGDGAPIGFTANSFTSVSLDPPLLLVCPGKFLSTYKDFAASSHFAINVLGEDQEAVSNTFASFKGDRFASVPHSFDAANTPLIDGALAQFSCATHEVIDAGDHCILMGRVEAVRHADGPGLGYAGGRYFTLKRERAAAAQSGRAALFGAVLETGGHVLLEETEDGLRPPQITAEARGGQRAALCKMLAEQGVTAHLSTAYSVFDEGALHCAYVLGRAETPPQDCPLKTIPIPNLPDQTYTTPAIAAMMTRYAAEADQRDFSLYLGDAQRGETHSLTQRR